MQLNLSAPLLHRIARAFRDAPDLAQEVFMAATEEASQHVSRNVIERTPRGVGIGGGLAGSILASRPISTPFGVEGEIGTRLAYAVPVELGTQPHMPPIEPLKLWVHRKLGLYGAAAEGAAWSIARKIAVKGTKGAGMFSKGLAASEARVEKIFEQATERFADRLVHGG